jgi:hypothetical protein
LINKYCLIDIQKDAYHKSKKKQSPAASQKSEGRQKMTYDQVTRNSIETQAITAKKKTQEQTLIKIMQEPFTLLEKTLSNEAEQMSSLMNLLTTVLNKLVK